MRGTRFKTDDKVAYIWKGEYTVSKILQITTKHEPYLLYHLANGHTEFGDRIIHAPEQLIEEVDTKDYMEYKIVFGKDKNELEREINFYALKGMVVVEIFNDLSVLMEDWKEEEV